MTMMIKMLTSETLAMFAQAWGQAPHLTPKSAGSGTKPVGTPCQPNMAAPNVNI